MTHRMIIGAMLCAVLSMGGLLPGIPGDAHAAKLSMPAPAATFKTGAGTRAVAGLGNGEVHSNASIVE